MKPLTRRDLSDIGMAMIIANTPASLFHQIRRLPAMGLLKTWPAESLSNLYQKLTARARRTEIEVGLAYAVLIAAVLSPQPVELDSRCMEWGRVIQDLAEQNKMTETVVHTSATVPPVISIHNTTPGGRIILGRG